MVETGWRGDHPVVQRDLGDECQCFHCRLKTQPVSQADICTCGARRTVQHNLGCPIREADDHRLQNSTQHHETFDSYRKERSTRFAKESAERKAAPLWSGVMLYFPDALMAVARLSKKANDKHNPGTPLHWSKEKSNDHGDCLTRHQLEPEKMDEELQEIHAVHVAWRALAQLQIIIERQRGKQA